MGLFTRKRETRVSDYQVQIASRIASRLLSAQHRMAGRINSWLSRLPVPVLLAFLVALGTAFGIYCAYLLLRVFF